MSATPLNTLNNVPWDAYGDALSQGMVVLFPYKSKILCGVLCSYSQEHYAYRLRIKWFDNNMKVRTFRPVSKNGVFSDVVISHKSHYHLQPLIDEANCPFLEVSKEGNPDDTLIRLYDKVASLTEALKGDLTGPRAKVIYRGFIKYGFSTIHIGVTYFENTTPSKTAVFVNIFNKQPRRHLSIEVLNGSYGVTPGRTLYSIDPSGAGAIDVHTIANSVSNIIFNRAIRAI